MSWPMATLRAKRHQLALLMGLIGWAYLGLETRSALATVSLPPELKQSEKRDRALAPTPRTAWFTDSRHETGAADADSDRGPENQLPARVAALDNDKLPSKAVQPEGPSADSLVVEAIAAVPSVPTATSAATAQPIAPVAVEATPAPPTASLPEHQNLPVISDPTNTEPSRITATPLDEGEPENDLSNAPIERYQPLLQFQAATLFQEDELSGRLRASALYALNDQVMFGATVDLVGGDAFVDSADEGLSLNELYVAAAPFRDLPNLRLVGGLIDLTAYLDRNSFAKDVVTHFFHPVFQTNPALSAAGLGSRPGLLVNWSATDQLEIKAAAFSSSRELGDLALDGFAAEAGFRTGNFIVRGTFSTARDAGNDSGFEEIFQLQRSDGSFGPLEDDREVAYGLNAEYFIESLNLGLFGRYGWYENQDIGRSGVTFSFGANLLDVLQAGDRLGLGYGQQLSNDDLRSGQTPDVWEIFYDTPIFSQVRAGISLQSRDEFSNTGLGLRVRADW